MRIREATEKDKYAWDTFIDSQDGSFYFYYDWKYVHEFQNLQLIQIIVENTQLEFICIFTLVRTLKPMYSILESENGGPLFKKDFPITERYQVLRTLIGYIEKSYSSGCSSFIIEDYESNTKQNSALIDSKFRLRFQKGIKLPCLHVLPLKMPFEENIWKGLWSQKFRQALNKVAKNGVRVIQDPELKYMHEYTTLLVFTYKRHKSKPPSKERIMLEFNYFKDKTKLFVATFNEQPIVILSCHYSKNTCYLWGVGSMTKATDDANKLCYKAAIADACNNGYQFVDFGRSFTESLANLKERFAATRIPITIYEKRYSFPRVLFEKIPYLAKALGEDRNYILKNGDIILDRIFRW